MDNSFLLQAAEKVIVPIATALIGVVVTLWQTSQKKKDERDAQKQRLETVESLLASLSAAYKKDFEALSASLQAKSAEVRQAMRSFAKLTERYATLEGEIGRMAKNIEHYDVEMATFIKEQQELWRGTNQQIGQVEGYLKAMHRRDSSSFQSPTKMR